jgi:uncharacterized protein YutE (UPF0331/DUF86 family)
MGELGVVPPQFAQHLPSGGFRNTLVREYLGVDWDEGYRNLHQLESLERPAEPVRAWLRQRGEGGCCTGWGSGSPAQADWRQP